MPRQSYSLLHMFALVILLLRQRSYDIRGRLSSCGWKSCNTRNSSSSGPTTNWRHPIRSNVNPAAIQPQSSLNPSEPQSIGASTSIHLGHLLAPSGLCLGLFLDSFWPHPGHLELKKRAFLVHIKTHFVPSDISLLPWLREWMDFLSRLSINYDWERGCLFQIPYAFGYDYLPLFPITNCVTNCYLFPR